MHGDYAGTDEREGGGGGGLWTSRTVDRRLIEPEKTRSANFSRILGEAG